MPASETGERATPNAGERPAELLVGSARGLELENGAAVYEGSDLNGC